MRGFQRSGGDIAMEEDLVAEREGFEPPEPLGSPDFESGRLNQTPEPLRARLSAFPLRGEQSSERALWPARRDVAIS